MGFTLAMGHGKHDCGNVVKKELDENSDCDVSNVFCVGQWDMAGSDCGDVVKQKNER